MVCGLAVAIIEGTGCERLHVLSFKYLALLLLSTSLAVTMHNLDSNHVTYGNLVAEAERDYNFFFLPLWFDRIFAKWWKILSSK